VIVCARCKQEKQENCRARCKPLTACVPVLPCHKTSTYPKVYTSFYLAQLYEIRLTEQEYITVDFLHEFFACKQEATLFFRRLWYIRGKAESQGVVLWIRGYASVE
ncbi:MAG TPA: hypothetical protein VMW24_20880, partial [Sedimentisphaerales bacterium]|nr:hypothetical protein [Sedimentisphaerales bacterium]